MAYTDNTQTAPRVDTNYPADIHLVVDSVVAANVDLTTVSGAGPHGAQRVDLVNNTAAAIVVVYIPEQKKDSAGAVGVASESVSVPPNQTYTLKLPIKALIASGSGACQAVAYWWNANRSNINR